MKPDIRGSKKYMVCETAGRHLFCEEILEGTRREKYPVLENHSDKVT